MRYEQTFTIIVEADSAVRAFAVMLTATHAAEAVPYVEEVNAQTPLKEVTE